MKNTLEEININENEVKDPIVKWRFQISLMKLRDNRSPKVDRTQAEILQGKKQQTGYFNPEVLMYENTKGFQQKM